MTDYTESLRLVLNDTADRDGLWGDDANTVFNLIEDAIAGYLQIDLTTTTILTNSNNAVDQSRYAMLELTGSPTATVSAQVPAVAKNYLVKCSFSTSESCVLHPSGGNGVSFTNGDSKLVYCDGTDMHEFIATRTGQSFLVAENNFSDLSDAAVGLVNMGFTATIGELNILDGATVTVGELNILDGATVTVGELNILDGATVTVAELNVLDGVTATVGELNYLDGVTSNIQTQLDGKAASGLTPLATGFAYWNGTTASIVGETNLEFVSIADVGGNVRVGVSLSGISGNGSRANIQPSVMMQRMDTYGELAITWFGVSQAGINFRSNNNAAQLISVVIYGVSA